MPTGQPPTDNERGGRPPFEPTDKQRGQVDAMVVCGIPCDQIAVALGISKHTLLKYFSAEIEVSRTKIKTQIGSLIVNTILGRGDNRLTDERARSTLAIFYAKTQMGWRETTVHEHRELEPVQDPDDAWRRVDRKLARTVASAPQGSDTEEPAAS